MKRLYENSWLQANELIAPSSFSSKGTWAVENLKVKPGPGTKIKTGPPVNDKNNDPLKMIERMIRHTIHFDILHRN